MRKFKKLLFSGLFVFAISMMSFLALAFSDLNFLICTKTGAIYNSSILQISKAFTLSNFLDVLSANWIWIVFAICSLLLIISILVLIYVCLKHNKSIMENLQNKNSTELNVNELSIKVEKEEIDKTESKEEINKAEQLEKNKVEVSDLTETQNVEIASKETVQTSGQQLNYEKLLNLILETEKNIEVIKNRLDNQERNESIKQLEQSDNDLKNKVFSERLDKIEYLLSKQKEESNDANFEATQNSKLDLIYKELNVRLDRVEELFKELSEKDSNKEYSNSQESQIREICKEINERIDRIEENMTNNKNEISKREIVERHDAEFHETLKNLNERIDKMEDLINSKAEEKSKVIIEGKQDNSLVSVYKVFDERLDKVEDLLKEQNEKNLKKEIEEQQRELDRINQDKLADKIAEKLQSQEKSMSNEELLEKLITRDESKIQVNPIINNASIKEEPAVENEESLNIANDDNIGDIISKDAIIIEGVNKLTLKEAYAQLPERQKKYFDMLKIYAQSKPHARVKEVKSYLNIGIGNKLFVKLTIKKNIVVACFTLESEEILMLKRDGNSSIKPEQTKIKIVDMNAYETAIKMIDIRVEQVNREIELTNNLRKEKQKKRYQDSKKA